MNIQDKLNQPMKIDAPFDETCPLPIAFDTFAFEVTRRCNLKCGHCIRGDAQQLTLRKEYVDAVLNQTPMIVNVVLTGGEPFLEPELVEYIVDGIIKRKIYVGTFQSVTNGTVCSERIARAFVRMSQYIASWKTGKPSDNVHIPVSNTRWHLAQAPLCAPELTVDFYRRACGEWVDVNLYYIDSEDKNNAYYYGGRAETLDSKFGVDDSYHRFGFYSVNHQGCELKVVACQAELLATGKFVMGGMRSFAQSDALPSYSVLDYSLFALVYFWNRQFPVTCKESGFLYHTPELALVNGADDRESMEKTNGRFAKFYQLMEIRRGIQQAAPAMPFEKIRAATWYPVQVNMDKANGTCELDGETIDARQKNINEKLKRDMVKFSQRRMDYYMLNDDPDGYDALDMLSRF